MKDMEVIEKTYTDLKNFFESIKTQGLILDYDFNRVDLTVNKAEDGRQFPIGDFEVTVNVTPVMSMKEIITLIDVSEG